jgi:hypothetical protein
MEKAEDLFSVIRADSNWISIQPKKLECRQTAKCFDLMEVGNNIVRKVKCLQKVQLFYASC